MSNICVLRIEGTNNEYEVCRAFEDLGAMVELVHLNKIKSLDGYQCLVIPGGFSAGDYVRAGAIFAALIESRISEELSRFVKDGNLVLGICNGFQVLIELGLLPFGGGKRAALIANDSNRFECRPTILKKVGDCAFTELLPEDAIMYAPSAHAEGKFYTDKDTLNKIIEDKQVIFRYVSPDGDFADYPWNPNGSLFNIASLCNPDGNVFGLMPHPERSFDEYLSQDSRFHTGNVVFQSALEYIERELV